MILVHPDRLLVTSGTATDIDVHVGYIDSDGHDGSRQGRQNTGFSTAVTIEVLSLTTAVARKVTDFNIRNKGTAASVVTVSIYDGSTTLELWEGTLDAEQQLVFLDGVGFVEPPVAKLDMMRYVTADSVHAAAHTAAVITGLTPFPVVAGHNYAFEAQFFHIANATTSGAEFFVGGVTATYIIVGSQSVVTAGVATTTMSSGVVTAVDTAVILQTTSSTAATVPSYIAGTIIPSQTGDLSFKASSEVAVAAGLTVKKGSWAHVRECDN